MIERCMNNIFMLKVKVTVTYQTDKFRVVFIFETNKLEAFKKASTQNVFLQKYIHVNKFHATFLYHLLIQVFYHMYECLGVMVVHSNVAYTKSMNRHATIVYLTAVFINYPEQYSL